MTCSFLLGEYWIIINILILLHEIILSFSSSCKNNTIMKSSIVYEIDDIRICFPSETYYFVDYLIIFIIEMIIV